MSQYIKKSLELAKEMGDPSYADLLRERERRKAKRNKLLTQIHRNSAKRLVAAALHRVNHN